MDKDFFVYLDAYCFNRIRVFGVTERGNVKAIMCQYETLINGKWTAIIRYDCAHGQFHKDIMFPNGDKEKQAVEIETLNEAFNYALQDIKDRWQFYLDRYVSNIRS
ncbi:MAG: hypothetical protein LBB36_01145 [Fibromonadaceae bacterium]|nr:hypothetical protein [Fibromonadaceae bacterium]